MTGAAGGGLVVAGGGSGDLSRFAELAGRDLYRRNVFAFTGLAADAQGRAVRRQRQRAEARLTVEDAWPGDAGTPSVGGYRLDEVRAAFEEFQDPRRRLVDELLWRWGEADLGCVCPPSVHTDHDVAVRSHVRALEWENGRLPDAAGPFASLWADAAGVWAALLEHPDFRKHIAHRITALDDPRLDGRPPGDFLAGLARLLVSPFTELASDPAFAPRLPQVCARWGEYAPFAAHLSELFEEVLEESAQRIDDGAQSVEERKNARRYGDAVSILHEQVLPEFERLDALQGLIPEWRHENVARTVAVSLNNLAVALQRYHTGTRPSPQQRRTVIGLAEKAYEIIPDRDAEAIRRNWAVIYDQFSEGGRIPGVVQERRPAAGTGPYEGTAGREAALCLLIVLGFVALVVQGFVMGFGAALLTGFLALVVIGAVTSVVEWARDIFGGYR